MARSVTIPSRAYTPGAPIQREIDSIPQGSAGYVITMTRGGAEPWTAGDCVRLQIDIAPDGVNFIPHRDQIFGASLTNRDGSVRTSYTIQATWPGENDGQGGRRVVWSSNVRVTMTALQNFTSTITIQDF